MALHLEVNPIDFGFEVFGPIFPAGLFRGEGVPGSGGVSATNGRGKNQGRTKQEGGSGKSRPRDRGEVFHDSLI